MLKSSTIAACVLALSGGVALAQTYPSQQVPYSQNGQTMSGTGTLDYGAQGPGMQNQGMQNQASAPADMDSPRAVAITDEYGNQYNSRGDRIGRGRPAARQQMR